MSSNSVPSTFISQFTLILRNGSVRQTFVFIGDCFSSLLNTKINLRISVSICTVAEWLCWILQGCNAEMFDLRSVSICSPSISSEFRFTCELMLWLFLKSASFPFYVFNITINHSLEFGSKHRLQPSFRWACFLEVIWLIVSAWYCFCKYLFKILLMIHFKWPRWCKHLVINQRWTLPFLSSRFMISDQDGVLSSLTL